MMLFTNLLWKHTLWKLEKAVALHFKDLSQTIHSTQSYQMKEKYLWKILTWISLQLRLLLKEKPKEIWKTQFFLKEALKLLLAIWTITVQNNADSIKKAPVSLWSTRSFCINNQLWIIKQQLLCQKCKFLWIKIFQKRVCNQLLPWWELMVLFGKDLEVFNLLSR